LNRRKFLHFSGFATASFIFTGIEAASGSYFQALQFPDSVSVRCQNEWITLNGSGGTWQADEIKVIMRHEAGPLSLFISAANRELEFIKCQWKQTESVSAMYLADHWERSYGDLNWETQRRDRKSPWYMLISNGGQTSAFGVKTGTGTICYWQAGDGTLNLFLDTHSGGSGVVLGERTLHAADIITTENLPGESPFQTDIRFCKMMCDKPVLPSKPVYGINDWYFAYGNSSRDLILDHTALMASLSENSSNPPFSVIDMGWSLKPEKKESAYCWGDDFTKSNSNFGDMSRMAADIKKLGMRPGLWTRPLQANSNDRPSALIPVRKDQTDLKERYLDPTIPENLSRIAETIILYKSWGYELVKHDYTSYDLFGRWGFEMNENMTAAGWHFKDRSRTNAEIILELYRTIRTAAGSIYLIGCNTFSHLSAGIFELNRIGDDTSGNEWARTLKMGVNTLGFRLPQHLTFYAADGDCVGLTTKIPWEKNKQWLQLLAESSAPLFISAQHDAVGTDQKMAIKKAFAEASRIQPLAEPLDWMTNPRPADWKLNGRNVHFDWT
jgi:alpha-galactosidase